MEGGYTSTYDYDEISIPIEMSPPAKSYSWGWGDGERDGVLNYTSRALFSFTPHLDRMY